MTDIVETIRQVCQHAFGDTLRKISSQLSTIRVSASPRHFLVSRMGSTGSTWVAKLLNSHSEVFCFNALRTRGITEKMDQIIWLREGRAHGPY